MGRKTNIPKKPAANKKPPSRRWQSRLQERLKVLEEFVASQREVLKALQKKLFH